MYSLSFPASRRYKRWGLLGGTSDRRLTFHMEQESKNQRAKHLRSRGQVASVRTNIVAPLDPLGPRRHRVINGAFCGDGHFYSNGIPISLRKGELVQRAIDVLEDQCYPFVWNSSGPEGWLPAPLQRLDVTRVHALKTPCSQTYPYTLVNCPPSPLHGSDVTTWPDG